jgi:hypothetical protein
MYQMTPFLKNKYPFLGHLKVGSLFYFIEIDMRSIVGNHTMKFYQNILKERNKIRNTIKREEENYNNYVLSVKEKEERRISQEYTMITKSTGGISKDDDPELSEEPLPVVINNISSENGEPNTKKLKNLLAAVEEQIVLKDKEEKPVLQFTVQDFPEISEETYIDNKYQTSKIQSKNAKKKKKFVTLDIPIQKEEEEIETKQDSKAKSLKKSNKRK